MESRSWRSVDLHAHILPGLDDGPATLEESLDLLRLLVQDGVGTVVATPHVAPGFFWPYDPARLADQVAQLQAAAAEAALNLEIVSGAEIYLSPELVPLAGEGRLPTLGASPYLLVELPRREVPFWTFETLIKLQRAGYRPILAHPELNGGIRADADLPRDLARQGILLQVDASSLTGGWGSETAAFARRLLQTGLAQMVASDAHAVKRRPPELTSACSLLRRDLDESAVRRLFCETPQAVLAGTEVPRSHGPTGVVQGSR